MALVNRAIDKIGMTPFQWKLFFLNGFGYAVDSLLIICQSIAQPQVTIEYGSPSGKLKAISLGSQIGLLVGAAFWGLSADIIGRRFAFNASLLLAAVFVVIAGGMPGYVPFAALVALYSFAVGGNYILDSTSLLEFLPTAHSWLVTFMSIWWAVGYTVAGLLAWAFLSNYSCPADATPDTCAQGDNMGWRYLHFTCGGLVLVLSILRLLVVRMVQTPKWLIAQNRDEEVISFLADLAAKEGNAVNTEQSAWSSIRISQHVLGLFQTRPLYNVFLPYYLQSQGRKVGASSNYLTWRNYAINKACGLIGPLLAAVLVETKFFGRRGTMALGALTTMVLQFGYTQIRTPAQNVGVSAAITAASNMYYGTIYAYTPEILPSAHRATGYALCLVVNRVGGTAGVLVGSYANVETTARSFLLLPFESRGKRIQ
ncbi:hypothetical protein BDV12DRAFT_187767 [Aspergillus spectabilis]